MRLSARLIVLALLSTSLFAGGFTPKTEDEKGIAAAIDLYFQGHATGDGNFMRRAFVPEANLFFVREGKLATWTSEEFAGRMPGKAAADEAQRKRWIELIHASGDAGMAVVKLHYPQVTFTDYMSLLRIDGTWRIVNKTFHADRRPPAK